jgi:hypothetical protein
MPGSLVKDNLASNIATGSTLNAAGTTNGTVVQIEKPGVVRFELATPATITGTSATLDVEIKGADDLAFSVNVVSYGRFSQLSGSNASQQSLFKYLAAQVYSKYVRATVILGGTSPVYTGLTITPRPFHYQEKHSVGTATGNSA